MEIDRTEARAPSLPERVTAEIPPLPIQTIPTAAAPSSTSVVEEPVKRKPLRIEQAESVTSTLSAPVFDRNSFQPTAAPDTDPPTRYGPLPVPTLTLNPTIALTTPGQSQSISSALVTVPDSSPVSRPSPPSLPQLRQSGRPPVLAVGVREPVATTPISSPISTTARSEQSAPPTTEPLPFLPTTRLPTITSTTSQTVTESDPVTSSTDYQPPTVVARQSIPTLPTTAPVAVTRTTATAVTVPEVSDRKSSQLQFGSGGEAPMLPGSRPSPPTAESVQPLVTESPTVDRSGQGVPGLAVRPSPTVATGTMEPPHQTRTATNPVTVPRLPSVAAVAEVSGSVAIGGNSRAASGLEASGLPEPRPFPTRRPDIPSGPTTVSHLY